MKPTRAPQLACSRRTTRQASNACSKAKETPMLSRSALESRPSSRKLLSRVLEMPELPTQIQALPGPVLGKLIDHVGLEDAAELVALATTEQLAQIFDED